MGWLPFRRLRTGSTGSTRRSARRAHSASHCWRPAGRSPSAVARTAKARSPPERRATLIVRKRRPVGALLASGEASVQTTRQLETCSRDRAQTGGVLLTPAGSTASRASTGCRVARDEEYSRRLDGRVPPCDRRQPCVVTRLVARCRGPVVW